MFRNQFVRVVENAFGTRKYRRTGRPLTQAVLTLCALCALCGEITAQEFRTLKDGIEYAEVTREIGGLKVNMTLLRLDLTKVRLDVHHAMDAAIGTEKTSSIAARHGAFAAINAGFFRLDSSIWAGDAAGVLQIDDWLYSESYAGRVALFIDDNQSDRATVRIEKLNVIDTVEIKGKKFEVARNRQLGKDDLVMFTTPFHTTTLTDPSVLEVIVRNKKVFKIVDGVGSSQIPHDGYVLSASGAKRDELLRLVNVGTKIKGSLRVGSDADFVARTAFNNAQDIVGGVPQLIKNGKIDITWEQEKTTKSFVETRHPRTAVAKLRDGKFLLITVDGRSESSGGIGLQDLAEYLLSLGATDAMNLDGGGSTTMFVDGKVVNHPSDKEGERKVSDAILVTQRKK